MGESARKRARISRSSSATQASTSAVVAIRHPHEPHQRVRHRVVPLDPPGGETLMRAGVERLDALGRTLVSPLPEPAMKVFAVRPGLHVAEPRSELPKTVRDELGIERLGAFGPSL